MATHTEPTNSRGGVSLWYDPRRGKWRVTTRDVEGNETSDLSFSTRAAAMPAYLARWRDFVLDHERRFAVGGPIEPWPDTVDGLIHTAHGIAKHTGQPGGYMPETPFVHLAHYERLLDHVRRLESRLTLGV